MTGDWFDDNMRRAAMADAQKVCEQAAQIAALKEALLPFAKFSERLIKPHMDDGDGCEIVPSVRELRRAKSAYDGVDK